MGDGDDDGEGNGEGDNNMAPEAIFSLVIIMLRGALGLAAASSPSNRLPCLRQVCQVAIFLCDIHRPRPRWHFNFPEALSMTAWYFQALRV